MKSASKPTATNQLGDAYPKWYFYRRLVHAKLFMDQHYAENIGLRYQQVIISVK